MVEVASRLNVADRKSVTKLRLSWLRTRIKWSAAGKDTHRKETNSYLQIQSQLFRGYQAGPKDQAIHPAYPSRKGDAKIRPIPPEKCAKQLGRMKGTAKIVGDIVSPIIDLEEIEAPKD